MFTRPDARSSRSSGDGSPRAASPGRRDPLGGDHGDEHADDERREDERRNGQPNSAEAKARERAQEPLPRERAGHPEAEEHVPEEVERRGRRRPPPPRPGQLVGRMRDHELVADCGDDHPGDHHDVEVGVPSRARRVRSAASSSRARDPRDVVEVEPPQRRGAEEGEPERGEPRRVQVEL